jgi:Fe2+ transport system protein FeoA
MTLSQMKPGQSGRIEKINRDDEYMSRLMELGLIEGETVTFIKKAPLGDPIEIRILDYNLSIRRSEADSINIIIE